jgi:hypothetical protein
MNIENVTNQTDVEPIDVIFDLPDECPVCQGSLANCFIDGLEAETCLSCDAVFYLEDKIQWN